MEAAIANIEVLKSKQRVDFPNKGEPPKIDPNPFPEYQETQTPLKILVHKEKGILEDLLADLE